MYKKKKSSSDDMTEDIDLYAVSEFARVVKVARKSQKKIA